MKKLLLGGILISAMTLSACGETNGISDEFNEDLMETIEYVNTNVQSVSLLMTIHTPTNSTFESAKEMIDIYDNEIEKLIPTPENDEEKELFDKLDSALYDIGMANDDALEYLEYNLPLYIETRTKSIDSANNKIEDLLELNNKYANE